MVLDKKQAQIKTGLKLKFILVMLVTPFNPITLGTKSAGVSSKWLNFHT